ncbi:MAG TPA: ATP-binding protein [Ktedonobacteraceae bacterium]|jgi:PAS domain S-box-containing protein|nr:ATP-binding protein [Ktedonobacteraceae bacterium]
MIRHISLLNRYGLAGMIVLAFVLLAITFSRDLLYAGLFQLHAECYNWLPSLIMLHVISDTLIGLAYVFISAVLLFSIYSLQLPFQSIFIAFGAFIICCGATHFVEVITTLWAPVYWLAGSIKLLTAIISLGTAFMLPSLLPKIRSTLANTRRANAMIQEIEQLNIQLRENYMTLADAMPLLVWTRNEHLEAQLFNKTWTTFSGMSLEKLKTQPVGSWMHPDDSKSYRDTLERRSEYVGEIRFRHYDGVYLWHLMHSVPLWKKDGHFQGWLSTATNIDKQKRNEQALSEVRERQDLFLSMTAHELNTPLTSMQLLVTFLQRNLGQNNKYSMTIEMLESQLQRFIHLVGDLLDMSRVKAGRLTLTFTSCDVCELVRSIIHKVQHSTTTHTLHLSCETTATINADPDRLEQVLVNLLSNAIKYSPEAKVIDIRVISDASQVVVSIQDYGIGISQEAQSHLFEQYYRSIEVSSRKYPGLGIGLYIVYEIVKQHHGKIWMESEEGKGATFFFALPLSP